MMKYFGFGEIQIYICWLVVDLGNLKFANLRDKELLIKIMLEVIYCGYLQFSDV